MTDPTFAQPLAKLGDSGIGVAAAPSGGQGLALDQKGSIPHGVLFIGTAGDGASKKIDYGVSSVVWPGGSATSNTTTVNHSLGVTPNVVIVTVDDSGTFRFSPIACTARTSTTLTFQAQSNDTSSPALNTAVGFDWLAIG